MHDERACKAHALTHAAGQLLGIGVLEAVEADEVDRRERALAPLGRRSPRASSPISTFSCTVSQGNSAKDWNTIETPSAAADDRRAAEGDGAAVGWIRPAIERKSVDLPEPDRPRRPTISPSRKVISTPSRTTRSGVEPLW